MTTKKLKVKGYKIGGPGTALTRPSLCPFCGGKGKGGPKAMSRQHECSACRGKGVQFFSNKWAGR